METRYPQHSYCFRLSGDGFLNVFRDVVLVAAPQDELVASSSALLESNNVDTPCCDIDKPGASDRAAEGRYQMSWLNCVVFGAVVCGMIAFIALPWVAVAWPG